LIWPVPDTKRVRECDNTSKIYDADHSSPFEQSKLFIALFVTAPEQLLEQPPASAIAASRRLLLDRLAP